jgi:hypothetical protein
VAKIVNGKALAAAHIENMGKASNAASGDFGHNPQGRDDLDPWRCPAFAYLPPGKPRSALLALAPNRLRRTHAAIVNRPWRPAALFGESAIWSGRWLELSLGQSAIAHGANMFCSCSS